MYKLFAVRWRIPSVQWRVFSTDVLRHQYGGGTSSVRWRMCSTVEGMQYIPVTPSVRMCHIISKEEGVQYGPVTPSVQWRVCSTGLPKLLRGLLVVEYIRKEKDILQTTLL